MYYVLFHCGHGYGKEGFKKISLESGVIEFLHEHYKEIRVYEIIEVKAGYRLGLIVTEEYVKSILEPGEETESLVPLAEEENVLTGPQAGKNLSKAEILKQNKKTLEELEDGEASAMSKIADDIEKEQEEEELTDEEKVQGTMDEADELIEREKKREEQKKKGWKLCVECNSNRVAPWNKKKICSVCQGERNFLGFNAGAD